MQTPQQKNKTPAAVHSRFRLHKPDWGLLIVAVIGAVFLWAYITSTITPDYTVSFKKLPVIIDLSGTRAESFGLSLMPSANGDEFSMTVDCDITGTRTAIGGLSRADVVAYVDFDSNVADVIGTQTLPIRLRTSAGTELSNVKLSQDSVDLTLDRYETRSFPVEEVLYPNLTVDDETRISKDEITFEPANVQISGPSTQLSAVDHIRVNLDAEEELTQTKTFTNCTRWSVIDGDGNVVSEHALSVQATRFSVRIPVFYSRSLPVTINIANAPSNFDVEQVLKRVRLNTNAAYSLPGYGDDNLMITIETTDPANKANLDQLKEWTIDSVPLSSLTVGNSVEIPITMAEGFTDSSNIGTVYVSLDDSDLVTETRWVKNSDILLLNGDQRYNYRLESPGGNTPIILIGTQEELNLIADEDLRLSVNLITISVSSEGVYTQVLSVSMPDTVSGVWVSPTPTVNIAVSLDE